MADQDVLERFVQQRPLAVMTRLALDEMFQPKELAEVFKENRCRGYEQNLRFEDLCTVLADIVLEFSPSPTKAYKDHKKKLGVSKTAFFNKLNNTDPQLSRALVRHGYQKARRMLELMNVPTWSYLSSYQTIIIDGNSVAKCERRILELRSTWQRALPSKSVVVMDADRQLIQDVYPLEDGQAQERTVLDELAGTIEAKQLVLADSAYCTIKFMAAIDDAHACFIFRQHGSLRGELLGKRRFIGRSETGKVYEQSIQVGGVNGKIYRRVTVELFEPTVDGDTVIHLLTNLPEKDADAATVAQTYRLRWEIEHKFYVATVAHRCEVESLGYPRASIFVFAIAMMALNCRQALFGALYVALDEDVEEEASHVSVSEEIQKSTDGLNVALGDEQWQALMPKTPAARMAKMIEVAGHYDRVKHRKSVRGAKGPPTPKGKYRNGHHLSVYKILAERNAAKTC